MSYRWNNTRTRTNSVLNGFQEDQSCRLNIVGNRQFKTKAYLNPEIVNCEYIKRSLSNNYLQGGNKIHVNPNFKGSVLNKVPSKTNFQLSESVQINSNELTKPGPSNITSISNFNSNGSPTEDKKRPCNAVTITHQSRFKKVNVGVKNKNVSHYSWSSTTNNSHTAKSGSTNYELTSIAVNKPFGEKFRYTSSKNAHLCTLKNSVLLPRQKCQTSKNFPVFRSKTKIINESKIKLLNNASPKNKFCLKEKKIVSPIKRHLALSQFVLNNKISPATRVARAVLSKYKYLNNVEEYKKSKYKIDKRNKMQEIVRKKLNTIKDIRKLFPSNAYKKIRACKTYKVENRYSLFKDTSSWRCNQSSNKITHKIKTQFPNKRVVKIGGILYKSTTNKLTLATKSITGNPAKSATSRIKAKRNHIVYVRGEKFILENNGKALRRQTENAKNKKSFLYTTKRIDIGGVTYIQKSQNVLIRTNVHRARHLVNKAKNKSIALLANIHKKSSMPCMIYHRFGKCNRHNQGLCIYKHDPKNIAICKKFLKGNCENANCLLSHEVIQEKMATCRFFLNGLCVRDNCPYLHVKLNKKVAMCKDFLHGFCKLGKNCSKWHFDLCPRFEKYGVCNLGAKCHYPHKQQERTEIVADRVRKNCESSNDENEKVQNCVGSNDQKKQKRFKKSSLNGKESCSTKAQKKIGKMKTLSLKTPHESSDAISCFPKRIRLENLPCYIPLKSDS